MYRLQPPNGLIVCVQYSELLNTVIYSAYQSDNVSTIHCFINSKYSNKTVSNCSNKWST